MLTFWSIGFICIVFPNFLSGQIRPDFLLAKEGNTNEAYIVYDHQRNLHTAWGIDAVYYGLFDSLGYPVKPTELLSANNKVVGGERIAVRNDRILVVWQEFVQSFNSFIFGQLLTINGDPLFGSFRLNDEFYDAIRGSPDVAFINDSTFIVVWSGDGPLTPSTGVYGQMVTTSLNFIGSNLLLSDQNISNMEHGNSRVLIPSTGGDFVVVWRDNHLGSHKVFGRLFFPNGAPKGSSFLISENPQLTDMWSLSACIDNSGTFAVVWGGKINSLWQIQWRRYWADGTPISPSEKVNSNPDIGQYLVYVDIAFDYNGKCIIVWEQIENAHFRIFGQRFLPDGTPLGNNFKISTFPDTLGHVFPNVTLFDGRMCTVWRENKENGDLWANIIDYYNPPLAVSHQTKELPPPYIELLQNYPNPFNSTTTIRFYIPKHSYVHLEIYNIAGQKIRTLVNDEQSMGEFIVQWNGKNESGEDVSSGIYFYSLKAGYQLNVRKMMLLR